MASQYKNLFFDLDDTLWAFSLNARDTFEEMYQKYDYDRFFRSFQHFYTLYQYRNVEQISHVFHKQLLKINGLVHLALRIKGMVTIRTSSLFILSKS